MSTAKNKIPKISNSFDKFSTKRVSYILVTKNRASLLNDSLERVKKLKKKNDELIVVDGDSTDFTFKVIKNYRKIIDKYISEPDLNASHATNKAILISSGKYIKLLTDDDIVYSRPMQKAISILNDNPRIDILECGGTLYNTETKRDYTFYKPPGINFGNKLDDMFRFRSNGMGIILRRSSLAKLGLFPLDLIADATFLINAFKSKAVIKFCRLKLYKHVIHSENISGRPEISNLIYKAIRDNSSKKYFLKYAINWHVSKYPVLKFIIIPAILINNFFRENRNHKSSSKKIYKWDGGFS